MGEQAKKGTSKEFGQRNANAERKSSDETRRREKRLEENAGREELKKSKGRREEDAAERAGSMEIRAEIYGKYQQSNERGIKIAGKAL